MKTACVIGALLAMAACGKSRPAPAPEPASDVVLEEVLDHYSECVQSEASGAEQTSCTSCHAGGEPSQSVAKVLVGDQYVDLCVPGLM